MLSASKLFTYFGLSFSNVCMRPKFRIFMSCNSICCMCGMTWSSRYDVSLSQGSLSTPFRWGGHTFHVSVKRFFLITAVQKLQKNCRCYSSYDHKSTATFLFNSRCIWSSWCLCHPTISCSSKIQNSLTVTLAYPGCPEKGRKRSVDVTQTFFWDVSQCFDTVGWVSGRASSR